MNRSYRGVFGESQDSIAVVVLVIELDVGGEKEKRIILRFRELEKTKFWAARRTKILVSAYLIRLIINLSGEGQSTIRFTSEKRLMLQ